MEKRYKYPVSVTMLHRDTLPQSNRELEELLQKYFRGDDSFKARDWKMKGRVFTTARVDNTPDGIPDQYFRRYLLTRKSDARPFADALKAISNVGILFVNVGRIASGSPKLKPFTIELNLDLEVGS